MGKHTIADAMKLRELVETVEHAVSRDPCRATLRGILLREEPDGRISATATDGYRLARAFAEIPGLAFPLQLLLLSPDDCGQLKKTLHKKSRRRPRASWRDASPGILLDVEHRGTVNLGNDLARHDYPKTDQVIPDARERVLGWVLGEDVIEATRELLGVDCDRVRLTLKGKTLRLSAEAEITGGKISGESDLKVEPLHSGKEASSFVINGRYLVEAMVGTGARVLRPSKDHTSPALLTRPGSGFDDLAVIMPIKL